MSVNYSGFVCIVTVVIACAALLTPVESTAADKKAQKIIDRVEKTMKKLETFTCSFRQEYVLKEAARTRILTGTIRTKTPNRLRVEYSAQTIVVDGETVWQYIPKNNQVTVQEFEEDEEMFPTPHSIFTRHITRGNAVFDGEEMVGDRTCDILRLVSADDDSSEVTVWVDRKLNFPVKSVEEKPNGDVVTYVLNDVKLNEAIKDDVFTFNVPDGIEVVDMRE